MKKTFKEVRVLKMIIYLGKSTGHVEYARQAESQRVRRAVQMCASAITVIGDKGTIHSILLYSILLMLI